MRKILLTIAFVTVAATSAFAQISVGAGYANNTTKVADSDKKTNTSGIYVEGSYNIPITQGLSIVPGLRYEYTTSSTNASLSFFSYQGTLNEHTLMAPVHAQYSIGIGDSASLILFAGPTFNYGLSSTFKNTGSALGATASKTEDLYANDYYNRFDISLGGGAGIQIGSFQLKVGYDFGLLNRVDSDNITCHTNQLRAGIAYLF